MKKLMTAVLAVCPKVRGSASDLRQVDVRSRHCAQCPPQPDKRNVAGAEAPELHSWPAGCSEAAIRQL
jgi:hypothetical protein